MRRWHKTENSHFLYFYFQKQRQSLQLYKPCSHSRQLENPPRMATPEDDLETAHRCCVCLETSTDCKVLPCLHVFCDLCVEKNFPKSRPVTHDGRLICPVCGVLSVVDFMESKVDKVKAVCKRHRGGRLLYFCEDHTEMACVACVSSRHAGCSVLALTDKTTDNVDNVDNGQPLQTTNQETDLVK